MFVAKDVEWIPLTKIFIWNNDFNFVVPRSGFTKARGPFRFFLEKWNFLLHFLNKICESKILLKIVMISLKIIKNKGPRICDSWHFIKMPCGKSGPDREQSVYKMWQGEQFLSLVFIFSGTVWIFQRFLCCYR